MIRGRVLAPLCRLSVFVLLAGFPPGLAAAEPGLAAAEPGIAVAEPGLPAAEPAVPVAGKAAFERMKTLAGTWEGLAGHDQPGQAATVIYRVASGGSVVEETLFPGTPHEMISMYHVVDGELVLTHYCAMANQPHMRLDREASTPERFVFVFDGGTNFDPAKDTHIHSGVVEWKGDTLHNAWAVYSGGKPAGQNEFVLTRKK